MIATRTCPGCGVTFAPAAGRQKFCTHACNRRTLERMPRRLDARRQYQQARWRVVSPRKCARRAWWTPERVRALDFDRLLRLVVLAHRHGLHGEIAVTAAMNAARGLG